MEEAANVRLVRCPKCENLLPELPGFSLYQCGGCGAVLKAKKKGILEDGLSEISNDIKGRAFSEEDSLVKASEADMESPDGIDGSRIDKIHNEELDSNGSSRSKAEGRKLVAESDTNRRGKERIRRTESFDDDYQPYSQGIIHNSRNHGKNRDSNSNGPDYARFHSPHIRPEVESSRSRPVYGPDRGGVSSQARYDDFLHGDVGPSSYDYDERKGYRGRDMDELARIENLEIDKAELLKKLDELKDKISRSSEMVDPPKQRIGNGRKMASYVQEGLTSSRTGFIPYTDGYGSRGIDTYPQRGYPHEFVHYDNSNAYKHKTFRGPSSQPHSHYMQRPYNESHLHGYYGDANHDLFMLHRHENFFHQPACSCVHCCDRNWHNMPHEVEPLNLHNRRPQNEPSSNPNLHHHLNPVMHRPNEGSFGNLRPLQSRQSLILNSNEMDSENDGFSNHHRPRKFVVAHRSGRLSRPIAGGAPFVTCSSCFELLKLQRKHISLGKDQQKMKCGACSSIIAFELGNMGFIASESAHVDQVPTEIDEGSSGTVDENAVYWNDALNSANANAFSDDYDDSHHKFSATENNKSDYGESEKQLDPLSSTSSLSGKSPENILSRNGSQSLELPLTKVKSFTDNESSPKELADNSPEKLVVRRSDKLSQSKRPEQERVSLDRTASGQSSVKDATEIDVPLNEFSNSYVSQDSVEVSKEATTTKGNKGGESFLAGLIKKSFRDFKKSNGESQVFVNGHLIPERAVKKAEKLAGPIQPGEYWYDKQAGFWGVMGHPCLGIVMPNIEEFNYPLPKNCAAGNTGVFVNGRELHQKDLDLLASRGLPITRNRSYIVEITGSIVDEQTGEELDGLGKLAPTVERAKHGFGMKVPRFLVQS